MTVAVNTLKEGEKMERKSDVKTAILTELSFLKNERKDFDSILEDFGIFDIAELDDLTTKQLQSIIERFDDI